MRLKKCACGTYTMKDKCGKGHETFSPKPAKFSPEDAYGTYRRKAKEVARKEKGLL
ncbi:MAG: nucleolar RNA-binding Nop10p family protein [Candidatus Woesearchaeota archaeon]